MEHVGIDLHKKESQICLLAGASTSGDSTNTPAYRRLTARKALAEEKGGAGAMELMSIRPPDWAGGLRWIPGW